MASVGYATLSIVPSIRGMAGELNKQLKAAGIKPAEQAGTQSGNAFTRGFSKSIGKISKPFRDASRRMAATFVRDTNPVTRGLANFAVGFADAAAAASAFTGRMGSLGGVARRALDPGMQAVGRFRDGFMDSSAAASVFSGRLGSLGGVARTALQPAIAGAQRLHSGFTSSQAAASAFSGRLGTLGGVARTALQPAITAVGAVGHGISTVGTGAATAFGRIRTGVTTAFGAMSSVGGRALGGIRSGLSSLAESARNASAGVGGIGSSLAQLGGIGAAALGAIGIGQFVKGVFDTSAAIGEARASLTGMYGDAEQAEAMVSGINDEFARSSVGVGVLNSLAANLAYMGFEGEKATNMIRNIDTAAGALPGNAGAAVESVSNALLTSQVQGNAFVGELNQISRVGFPIFDALAEHIGVSSGEIKKMASEGEISFDDLMHVMNDPAMSQFWEMTEQSAQNTAKTFRQTFTGITSMVQVAFAEIVAAGLDRLAPGLNKVGDAIEGGLEALPGVMTKIKDTLVGSGVVDGFWRLVDGVKEFGAAAMPAIRPFAEVIVTAFLGALKAMGPVGDLFRKMAGWMRENEGVVRTLGAVLGGLVVGMVAVRTATMAWAVVQSILNAAMAANPIGLIVIAIAALVAGIVYAYRNFEGFRNVVDGVWKAIKTAAIWIWEKGLKPAFEGIKTGLSAVGDGFSWLWNSAMKPAWDAIVGAFQASKGAATSVFGSIKGALISFGDAVMGLWTDYISPVFQWIWALIKNVATLIIVILIAPVIISVKAMGAIFTWLWSAVIKPVFQWIGDAAVWLWSNAIKPVWDFIVGGVKQVGQWFVWLWANAIKPAIDWIAAGALWLWNNAIKPAWDFIVGGVKQLGQWFTWLWNQIKSVFNWIAGHVTAWWNRTKALFNLVVSFVRSTLAAVFTWFRDKVIKPVWDFISRHISNVWNNGIKPAFDKVKEGVQAMRDAFGKGKDAIKKAWDGIRDSAKKPINFLIDTVYNKGIMPLWNKVAGVVGATKLKEVAKFATGGPVYGAGTATSDSIPALLSNQEHVWTAREVSGAGGHGAVEALRQQALSGGTTYARGGAVGFPNAPAIPSGKRMLDALKDFVSPSGLFSAGVDLISGNYKSAIDKVLKPARDITGEIGTTGFPGIPHQIVKTGGDKMKEKIESLVSSYNATLSAAGGGSDTWVGFGSASDRLQGAARWADTQHGKPYQWGGGGNPSWDCSGFMAGIENVIRGLTPGRRYTTHSFAGTPPAGWQKNLASPFTVGVQHGGRGGGHMAGTLLGKNVESGGRGVVTGTSARGTKSFPHQFGFKPVVGDLRTSDVGVEPSLYDQGGLLKPGLQLVYNGTGKPETVRTAAQEARVERLVEAMERGGVGNVINVQPPPATLSELVDGVSYALRRSRRGGVHAGVR